MENLPIYISITFILTTLLTVFIFYKAANNSTAVLLILLAWLGLQAFISKTGFYTFTNTIPPRLMLAVFPTLLMIIILFITKSGRRFIDSLDIKILTLLHIIRIPVELVLWWLFINKAIPQVMTFEGHNFDILSGITAPIIYYFVFIKGRTGINILLLWNFICLALLLNIIITAVLSAPFPFQQLALDQPNIAVLYFPYVWLPCCIVPLVLFSHLASIRQILRSYKARNYSRTAN